MANTNIKKNASGYGYQYTDLAEIHNYLESQNITYYQYIEPEDGVDYMWTVPIIDGKEKPARRGCRIMEAKLSGKDNPVQAYGASLTYCRRYSLLMAMGLATTDDDAACLTVTTPEPEVDKSDLIKEITTLRIEKNIPLEDILKRAKAAALDDCEAPQLESIIRSLKKSAVRK